MNIVGLGDAVCNIADAFAKYPQYKIFKIISEICVLLKHPIFPFEDELSEILNKTAVSSNPLLLIDWNISSSLFLYSFSLFSKITISDKSKLKISVFESINFWSWLLISF